MTTPTETQVMTARSPEDVLAAVPIVLGFVPEESVVMLTFGAEHPFHARVDIPVDDGGCDECAQQLLAPVLRHQVAAVLFVVYTRHADRAAACAAALVPTFTGAGVEVLGMLRSDASCWFAVSLDPTTVEGPGTRYDLSGHAFTAAAVASGRVTRSSRAELAATVAPDRSAIRAVAKARVRVTADRADPFAEQTWVVDTIDGLLTQQARADPPTAARLMLALSEPAVRDALLGGLERHRAEPLVPILSALVRAAPTDLVAATASVLAFTAWLAGDGALAWCALDRAAEGSPACALADLVGEALDACLPPAVWGRR